MRGGVSTAASVTEISGRGIGMDVVREAVARLGGDVSLRTEAGSGTTFELVVPLSLASVESLIIASQHTAAAIPVDAVRHVQRLAADAAAPDVDAYSVIHDGRSVPLVSLAALLGEAEHPGRRDLAAVIVAASGGELVALGAARLLGVATVVQRALPAMALAAPAVAGIAVDAEGTPQLVLDPDGLVAAGADERPRPATELREPPPVLVVDDSLTTRMLERSILEAAGYRVELATSGEEGLELARRKRFALILVDVEMPGIDGFTFIERLRADPALRDIPAILVTSLASPEHVRRGEEVGAQGYMVKSEFDQARLLARIRELAA
jgi:two-component system chemotaxis sensor kinase CheA